MKSFVKLSILFLILGTALFIQSCEFDSCHETSKYQRYDAVYMTAMQLRNITIDEAKPLKNPGKIYVYKNYLFINELYEGIHIFDNSDNTNPVNLSFISIPANVDIAVKENILYADNFIDLLSFDISDPRNPILVGSVENAFRNGRYNYNNVGFRVYYKALNVFEEIDCSEAEGPFFSRNGGDMIFLDINNSSSIEYKGDNSNSSTQSFGIGGSMARFTIAQDRLYIVDNFSLHIFNIETADKPDSVNNINLNWGIETIFPVKDKLFIGSNNGMYIYSASDPDNPTLFSSFIHASSCDPVFVKDDIAYVTLHSGTKCLGYSNQLDVIDIKNLLNPKKIKTYPMDNPHGLSILDDKLILCEGEYGLKVLKIENPEKIKEKSKITGKHFYDVIGLNSDDIIVVGNDGLYQYQLDGYDMKELSLIPISD